MIWTAFNGMCMALADSVPGVSGGTIAFILGFYERLLDSIHGLFRGTHDERRDAIRYLVKLGCGWLVGMAVAMTVLAAVLNSGIYLLCSAFLGLTLASIPFIVNQERATMRGHWGCLVFTVIGAAVVVGITLMRQSMGEVSLDLSALSLVQYLYVFVAGMVAISAMILPGISGSTLLLIFGVYAPTVMGIHQLMSGQLAVLPAILVLALGAVCGLALAIGVVRKALERFRPAMMYLIVGLMIGSLFAITMGPTTLSSAQPALSFSTFNVLAFIAGVGVLLALEAMRRSVEHRGAAQDQTDHFREELKGAESK